MEPRRIVCICIGSSIAGGGARRGRVGCGSHKGENRHSGGAGSSSERQVGWHHDDGGCERDGRKMPTSELQQRPTLQRRPSERCMLLSWDDDLAPCKWIINATCLCFSTSKDLFNTMKKR